MGLTGVGLRLRNGFRWERSQDRWWDRGGFMGRGGGEVVSSIVRYTIGGHRKDTRLNQGKTS